MTTSGTLVLVAFLVIPMLLGFGLPTRLPLLTVLGALALAGNWAWQIFFESVDADMPLWFAAFLVAAASLVVLTGCTGLALAGSWARRRLCTGRARGAPPGETHAV